jgi:hypothetical protein
MGHPVFCDKSGALVVAKTPSAPTRPVNATMQAIARPDTPTRCHHHPTITTTRSRSISTGYVSACNSSISTG